jgi:hypothetical protein
MALQDIVKKGATDRSVPLYAFDNTTGLAKADLAYNSSGVDLWYRREGAAKVSVTEATLAALTTAHTDGGFLAVGDGEYRLDLPDAAFATGANFVDYGGTFTGFQVVGGRVRLVDIDLEDTVRAGLTALPNAAAAATGGLPVVDSTGAVKAQARLKKNATGGLLVPFQMTDSTTHNPVAGKTVTVTRSLDGGSFAGIAGTVTELASGWYYASLTAADINGNAVSLEASATGCDVTPLVLFMEP